MGRRNCTMGIVTDYLIEIVQSNLEKNGIVVWYDPEKRYLSLAKKIGEEIPVFYYEGSYIELRYKLEPYLDSKKKGNALVYVPEKHDEVESPLLEVEYFGTYIKPGGPTNRNTRLEVIARKSLLDIFDAENIEGFEKKITCGSLTLDDLDELASKRKGIAKTGATSLIFDTTDPMEIAFQFLTSEESDSKIEEKAALNELAGILNSHLGLEGRASSVSEYRSLLHRYVLVSEFTGSLPEDVSVPELGTVPQANKKYQVDACKKLAETWRKRIDLKEAYVKTAEEVEKTYDLEALKIDPENLLEVKTFPCFDKVLINHAVDLILKSKFEESIRIFESRTRMFWASIDYGNSSLLWKIINKAALINKIAETIKKEISGSCKNAEELVIKYTDYSDSSAWYKLDLLKRQLDMDYSNYVKVETESFPDINSMFNKINQTYYETINRLAETFSEALIKDNFKLEGLPLQRHIFSKSVYPKLSQGKTAYFWIDALSYELAVDLYESLSSEDKSITFALATPPTITPIGMASLLPGVDSDFTLVTETTPAPAVKVKDSILKTREDRIKYLKSNISSEVVPFKLGDIPEDNKKLKEKIKDADLIIVTSQEIDAHDNEGNKNIVRKIMEETLEQIVVSIRRLRDCDVNYFVISSDHGHIFGEKLGTDMRIDPPGGKELFLDRRCWIGHGGTNSSSYFRVKPSAFGISGDFEFVFPKSIACFKTSGGLAFIHGGLSLQEFVIPVIELMAKSPKKESIGGLGFKIAFNKKKITSPFFTVEANFFWKQRITGPEEHKVRIEVRSGKEKGKVVSASFDYDHVTGELALKKDEIGHITLMLPENIEKGKVSVHLLDAETSKELDKIEDIEVSLLR